jgi:hypothetical protein
MASSKMTDVAFMAFLNLLVLTPDRRRRTLEVGSIRECAARFSLGVGREGKRWEVLVRTGSQRTLEEKHERSRESGKQ